MNQDASRILVNCLSSASGGALSYLRNMLPRLVREAEPHGGQPRFIILHSRRQRELFPELGETERIEVDDVSVGSALKRFVWEKRHLPRMVAERNIDRVFLPAQFGVVTTGVPSIVMIRNMEPFLSAPYRYAAAKRLRNTILAPLSRRVLAAADRVIAISEFAKRYCREDIGIPERKLALIYHGRDEGFSPDKTEGDEAVLRRHGVTGPYVFSCGSMLPYRRFEDIVAAHALLRAEMPEAPPLVLAGGQEDSRYAGLIHDLAAKAEPAGTVRHIGKLAYEEMQVFYRHSRVFVMSSEIEACPNVAIEAMTSGCAVVSCDKPPEPEMFQDAALFYPPRDARALADRLAQVLRDEGVRQELSQTALARAAFFCWDKCASETYQALTKPFD